jgi:hypothetical protein
MGKWQWRWKWKCSASQTAAPMMLVKKPEWERLSGYFNLDNGIWKNSRACTCKATNQSVHCSVNGWLRFRDIGATTLSISNTGGTDHLHSTVSAYPASSSSWTKSNTIRRTHHFKSGRVSNRIQGDDMKQAATIMAAFVYNTAMRDEKLPRKTSTCSEIDFFRGCLIRTYAM